MLQIGTGILIGAKTVRIIMECMTGLSDTSEPYYKKETLIQEPLIPKCRVDGTNFTVIKNTPDQVELSFFQAYFPFASNSVPLNIDIRYSNMFKYITDS